MQEYRMSLVSNRVECKKYGRHQASHASVTNYIGLDLFLHSFVHWICFCTVLYVEFVFVLFYTLQ